MTNHELQNFYRGKRVLVTGHTGFKGTWMCRVLELLGAEVTGYALEPPTRPSLFELCRWPDRFCFHHGDVRDPEALAAVFQNTQPEIVIHMAAQPLVRESYRRPADTFDVNVMGTVRLMDCIRRFPGVRSVINVTTDKVYRNTDLGRIFSESDELGGNDPYAASKACSELVTHAYICSYFDKSHTAVSTVRAGNVIGGGDFAQERIIPDCYRAAVSGQPLILRNPDAVRPFEHVLEPLYAYLRIAAEQYLDPTLAGSYNVGPDERGSCTVEKLVSLFSSSWLRRTGRKMDWEVRREQEFHESRLLRLDCTKVKNVFGISPVWDIQKAVEYTAEWYAAYAERQDPEECMFRQIEEYYDTEFNQ